VLRVDRGPEAAALQQAGRREAHAAASDDGVLGMSGRRRLLHRQMRRPPRHRHAAAAVAVVMNDRLVVELLGADDESGWPEGPEADYRANDSVGGDEHAGEAPPRLDDQRLPRA